MTLPVLCREELMVYRGDAVESIPLVCPPGRVSLVVMDPPYESLERHRSRGTTTRLKKSKASSNQWFKAFPNSCYHELFAALYSVCAPNALCYMFCDSETESVVLTGRNPYLKKGDMETSPVLSAGWRAWPSLTWVKTLKDVDSEMDPQLLEDPDIRLGMGYHWNRCDEKILMLEKGRRPLQNHGCKNVLLGRRAGKGEFPTQKPLNLVKRLIENSSEPGDLVLDCFAGSGVVGRAALELGRKAILIDIDTSWVEDTLVPDP